MSTEPRDNIVITPEELRDSKIDEVLELQRASTAGAIQPAAAPKKSGFRLIYTTWFYLMLAGALGAFLAWALIEPYFDDGLIFTARVESVSPNQSPNSFYGKSFMIEGKLEASHVSVWLAPARTTILGPGPQPKRYKIEDLQPGDVIKVMAIPTPDDSSVVAIAMRVEPPGTPVQPVLSASSMKVRQAIFAFLLIPLVAAFVGLTLGAVEGVVCRTFSRAAWCGGIGLLTGLVGGALSALAGGMAFALIGALGADQVDPTSSGPAFVLMMFRRGLAWTIAGMAMGLGQGFALKSGKLKLNGFIGGMVGGLIGGLLFDPIDLLFSNRELMQGAEMSRVIGFTIIGAAVGVMIGLTELLTRDAWLRVTQGPLRGKEFSFNRTPIRLGSSPKNEIYLFKDAKIDPVHAEINKLRDTYELADDGSSTGTFVNGQRIRRHRLADGDVICVGDSEFKYSTRENKTA